MKDRPTEHPEHAVAVIGLNGRFPGARNVEEFWANLVAGRETIRFFPDEELARNDYDFESVRNKPNYVKARGVLDDVEMFDARFFNFNPREASVLDPQHRIWLECAWEALEKAGVDPETYPGAIGVFAGGYITSYLLYNLITDREYIEKLVRFRAVDAFQNIISNDKDYLPTRTAYKFNLKGPAVNVQTACSTSLVAVCQACQSLLHFESDICLAGGVCITFPQIKGYLYQEGGMVSPDGHCRPFDARAAGTVFSNGVGVVVLKRLEDALADRDHIHAVILGSALNNDGALKVSYTAPSVEGQAQVIAMAQAMADVSPETITYIEAHGTATPLGDPIEVTALTKAFRARTPKKQFCGLGSVKSNLGHLDSAAGITGFLKAVLCVEQGQIPPSLHFEKPNPEIDFEQSPFRVITKLEDWKPADFPRRAGVSSFGVGGTNAHVVLEEAPPPAPSSASRPYQLLLLSARTQGALDVMTGNLGAFLRENPSVSLADAAFTLQTGRKSFEWRRHAVCAEVAEAVSLLTADDGKKLPALNYDGSASSLVFLFPGQGAQHVQMGRQLYEGESVFRDIVDRCAEVLKPILNIDLRTLLYPAESGEAEAAERLKQTGVTQPALFVIEYALARQWMSWGLMPAATMGHSVGEYVAAALAGVFEMEDALRVLAERARLMQEQPPGSMLAVRLPEDRIQAYLSDDVALAAINAPSLCVLSGSKPAIQKLAAQLEAQKIGAKELHTSHAFHSAMMEPVLAPFTRVVESVKRRAPSIPFISSLTGTWIRDEEATSAHYWARQIRHAVRFSPGLQEVLKEPGRVLLEVGPSKTLSTLALQQMGKDQKAAVVASLGHAQERQPDYLCILQAAGRLWQAGVRMDWKAFYEREQRRKVILPTYPFERQKYWIEPPKIAAGARPEAVSVMADAPVLPPIDPVVEAPLAPVAAAAPSASRPERITAKLRSIFYDLSGIELSETDVDTSFLELGLDSLFLTQASAELQNQFGVKVTFRQMLEDLTSLRTLAEYFDKQLPPEAFAEAPPPPVAMAPVPTAPVTAASGSPSFQVPAGADVVQQVVAEQLRIMNQQLDMLRQGRPSAEILALMQATQARQLGAQGAQAAGPVLDLPDAPKAADTAQAAPTRFGPYKKIEKSKDGGLTPRQQQHLDELISRFCGKTAESKRLAQAYRSTIADPRSVAGFRLLWKEMVYQIVAAKSEGSRIWDVDGNEYVDITMCFGANILGHNPPFVRKAMEEQLRKGFEIGPQTPLALKVAELVKEFTGMDRITFCNTGSEAVMAALRMARTVTNRNRFAFFSGDYHGTFDEVLAREQVLRGKIHTKPAAPGIPEHSVQNNLVLEYGSEASLLILEKYAEQLAAVLVEPIQSRHPDLRPKEFLQAVRELTRKTGTAMIFDEVITGFRVSPGGAQEYYGIRADVASYGKILGGGMPVGAVGGTTPFMATLDGGAWQYGDDSVPEADVTFFAGTFVRHPLAMAAAYATMLHLKQEGPALQQRLNQRADAFAQEVNEFFTERQVPIRILHFSSWYRFDYPYDLTYAQLLFFHLLEKGIYIREAGQNCFFSTAHTDEDTRFIVKGIRESVLELQEAGFLPGPAGGSAPAPATFARESGGEVARTGSPFPLTEPQKEIWLACQMSQEAACSYNESFSLGLRGPLHLEALQQALRTVVFRHEELHARFSSDGESQCTVEPAGVALEVEDLAGLTPEAREARVGEILKAEAATPFDLERGPLFRTRLLRLEPDHHVFIFTAHHIICDGASSGVVLEEMSTVYSELCKAGTPELPPPTPFREFAAREFRAAGSEEVLAAYRYWKEQFRDGAPVLELPVDRPRPPVKSYAGATVKHIFPPDLLPAAKKLAGTTKTTLFSLLLSTYKLLLHRLSGQNDLVVGFPAAGQLLSGDESLVGHCVNLLPLRTRFEDGQSFREYVAGVKSRVLDAYDHQRCSFGSLLKDLPLARDPSRMPLVEVIFNLDKDRAGLGFHGLEADVSQNPKEFVNFDLFFNFNESEKGLVVDCDYNRALLDRDTVVRWLGYFETLLRAAAANPDERIGWLTVLSAAEREQVLVTWNDTEKDYDRARCLHEWFEANAARFAGSVAVLAGDRGLTYGELNQQANLIAQELRARGVGPERTVGIYHDRTPNLIAALLGVLKAGGAYVPLDPAYPRSRMEFILQDADIRWLLTTRTLKEQLPATSAELICVEDIQAGGDRPLTPEAPASPGNLAYVIYTSGSTGVPKGVAIEHRNASALVNWALDVFSPEELNGVLAATSICFDLSVFEIFVTLAQGGTVVLAENVLALPALAARDRVTLVNTVPSAMTELLAAGGMPDGVRTVNLAGEPLARELVDAIYQRTKATKVYDLYGPSEDTTYSTFALRTRGGPVTIGRPIANCHAFILDANLQPVPPGVTGELYLSGAGVARGYLHRPELTAERFLDCPYRPGTRMYRTGDLARFRADGQIEFLGRADYQVKLRGYRIELGEIEAALKAADNVAEAVVIARDVGAPGLALAGYVVPRSGSLSTDDLRRGLKSRIPDYMVPAHLVSLAALPLTPNGKVDRKALPVPWAGRTEPTTRQEAPRDEIELHMVQLWKKLLGVPRVGIHDNFFELGGHSLLAVRVVVEVEKVYGKRLPLATLFQTPSVAQLADLLRSEKWTPTWSCLVPIQAAGSRPPLFLMHSHGGNVLEYYPLAQRLGPDQPVYAVQARGLDGRIPKDPTMEEMAEFYLREIRQLQPRGPYYLAGFCFGGYLALEAARQLQAAGEKIGLLALFQTPSAGYPRWPSGTSGVRKLWAELAKRIQLERMNLEQAVPGTRGAYVAERAKRVRDLVMARAEMLLRRLGVNGRPSLALVLESLAVEHEKALRKYHPTPFAGRMHLYPASVQLKGIIPDPTLGWGAMMDGRLEVEAVPGHQQNILREPNVRVLAEKLRKVLDAAQSA